MKKLSKCLLGAVVVFALVVGLNQAALSEKKAKPNYPSTSANLESKACDMVYPLEEEQLLEPLPWAEDPMFNEKIAQNNTPILMARYQATLPEPLPGEMYNVRLAANRLAGTVVPPAEIFSQNIKLGPYTNAGGYQDGPIYKGTQVVNSTGGGVCKIASLLYNVAILSNLHIVERYNHSMTVPYVPLGQDATVYYGVKDLRFLNSTSGPIVIWADTVGNTLYMAIYGQSKPPKVTWHHEILKSVEYWIIYRTNYRLPRGTENIVVPGQDGSLVRSWLTIEYEDGTTEQKNLGEDWYNVLPQVIERGSE